MKKILIATDFSANAAHAAEYGYAIASQVKADVVLCNAFIVPAEMPQGGTIVWPQFEYDELVGSSNTELKQLKEQLEHNRSDSSFKPDITSISEVGAVKDVITEITAKTDIELTVMGTHGAGKLDTFLVGNHSRHMINNTKGPLLLVPASAAIKPVKKVAFATDLEHPERDLKAIYELIPLLKRLNAELLLTHIYNGDDPTYKFKQHIQKLLVELSNKANYSNIFYRIVNSNKAERGLDWLCDHGHVDILAMVHRKHDLLDNILIGSHTQKMAGHIHIPLLVIPEK
ncbi:universal stress protein [Mucilaginibacter sp. BT774]|uniref:universal stress protein n=1 Tax=Mucilaginibacter sp. BT774 TaxID=3062276 RepID=UPI002674E3CE|nr:universal stress protein [Mucilaginibacter sp. BT774]MDO3627303.1 universal stress protein [Mucilaginibacter sp. BT774]